MDFLRGNFLEFFTLGEMLKKLKHIYNTRKRKRTIGEKTLKPLYKIPSANDDVTGKNNERIPNGILKFRETVFFLFYIS